MDTEYTIQRASATGQVFATPSDNPRIASNATSHHFCFWSQPMHREPEDPSKSALPKRCCDLVLSYQRLRHLDQLLVFQRTITCEGWIPDFDFMIHQGHGKVAWHAVELARFSA
jgi:hypothetical protein